MPLHVFPFPSRPAPLRRAGRLAAVAGAFALAVAAGCESPPARAPARGESGEVSFRVVYRFRPEDRTTRVKVTVAIPRSIPRRQRILAVEYSPPPSSVFDVGEGRYAEFVFEEPGEEFEVAIRVRAWLERFDLAVARQYGRPYPGKDLEPYLVDEPYLEAEDPELAKAAGRLRSGTDVETVRGIYDFVRRHLSYSGFDPDPRGGGARKALRRGRGDCTEYADLMVALCRASGIPARAVWGYYVSLEGNTPKHSWVEVWLEDHGWVPFDPTLEDTGRIASFARLPARYVYLSPVRNDPVLENYSFMCFRWWGASPELSEEVEIEVSGG